MIMIRGICILSDFRDADVCARDRIDVQLIVHNVSDWVIDFHAGTFPANTMPHSCQGQLIQFSNIIASALYIAIKKSINKSYV